MLKILCTNNDFLAETGLKRLMNLCGFYKIIFSFQLISSRIVAELQIK